MTLPRASAQGLTPGMLTTLRMLWRLDGLQPCRWPDLSLGQQNHVRGLRGRKLATFGAGNTVALTQAGKEAVMAADFAHMAQLAVDLVRTLVNWMDAHRATCDHCKAARFGGCGWWTKAQQLGNYVGNPQGLATDGSEGP